MNNEVAGKLNRNFDAPKNNAASNSIKKAAAQKTEFCINDDTIDKAMDFMGTLGAAQININKNLMDGVTKSTKEFLEKSDYVEAHVSFCDSLVNNGYHLEDAIVKTDKVFNVLRQKEIY